MLRRPLAIQKYGSQGVPFPLFRDNHPNCPPQVPQDYRSQTMKIRCSASEGSQGNPPSLAVVPWRDRAQALARPTLTPPLPPPHGTAHNDTARHHEVPGTFRCEYCRFALHSRMQRCPRDHRRSSETRCAPSATRPLRQLRGAGGSRAQRRSNLRLLKAPLSGPRLCRSSGLTSYCYGPRHALALTGAPFGRRST